MDVRRILLFFCVSGAFIVVWTQFVIPVFLGNPPIQVADDDQGDNKGDGGGKANAEDGDDDDGNAEKDDENADDDGEKPADVAEKDKEPPADIERLRDRLNRESQVIELGGAKDDSGFLQHIRINTRGAVVDEIVLNDPRYRELEAPNDQLAVVSRSSQKSPATMAVSSDVVNVQLKSLDKTAEADWLLDAVWDVVGTPDAGNVTLQLESPDGSLRFTKRFAIERAGKPGTEPSETIRDTKTSAYSLVMHLSIHNLGDRLESFTYRLHGPVNLPLENVDNTRKFRDVKVGFLEGDGSVDADAMTVDELVGEEEPIRWTRPIKYVGVDVQYFTALLLPGGDQVKKPYVTETSPVVVKTETNSSHSDISVVLVGEAGELAKNAEVEHEYTLFAGPKRQKLLAELNATASLDFSNAFLIGYVAKGMLWIMNGLHGAVGVPYGIAIIILTMIVRGGMFPLSKKQAAGAKKMKELQPQIAELKKKYANEKEKLAKAQMELFSKHNYNPFSGCLPLFLQLPIFIGLYQALNNSVDLRMAPFLWVDNLAAPDALFRHGLPLPIIGRDFNLLPLLVVGLFIYQQKVMMPEPTSPEQEMQQRVMKIMMIVLGFMFYRLPAGLCVYFLASSLWGLGERKALDLFGDDKDTTADPSSAATPKNGRDGDETKERQKSGPSFWQRLTEAADAAGPTGPSNRRRTADQKSPSRRKKSGRK